MTNIKVGDTVRITERYAEIGDYENVVGAEFVVTDVKSYAPWTDPEGEVFSTAVNGDPNGWGVWVNYLEVVEEAQTPTDEREALLMEARRAQRAVFLATDADVAEDLSRIIRGLADALEACSRRSEVPEPSTECPKCGVRATGQTPSTFYTHHDETCDGALEEPQGEPSSEAWRNNLSYAATALEASADNGDRYCARLIREHLAEREATQAESERDGYRGMPDDPHFTREFDDYRDAHPDWYRVSPYDIARSFWLAALRAARGA